MSKLVQKSAATAIRLRSMSSVSSNSKLTPTQIAEWANKVNPAQNQYGAKDPKLDKWQKFFQDPLNVEKPVYKRKGASDDMIVAGLSAGVAGLFIYNVYDFIFGS